MEPPPFVPPKWRKPAPLGYAPAMDSLGTVAAPLLAGFSLASVVVISDDAGNFLWPGLATLGLVVAAIMFVGAVQCSFNARQYIWSAADVLAWWPDLEEGSPREIRLRYEQDLAFGRWKAWVNWARITYDVGILALLAALALVIPPLHSAGVQGALRWVASGVAFVACAGEASWIVISSIRRSAESRSHGKSELGGAENDGRPRAPPPSEADWGPAFPSIAPPEDQCPECGGWYEHDPGCPYEGLSMAEANRRHRSNGR
jgi:hypothetical protein